MNNFQLALPQRLVDAVNRGFRGAYGITSRERDHQLYLITQRCDLPVVHMRLRLVDNSTGAKFVATETDFAYMVGLLDDYEAKNAHLAIWREGENDTLISSEHGTLSGYLFVVAAHQHRGSQPPYGLCAIFSGGNGTVLADDSVELLSHWNLTVKLLEEIYHGV